MSSPNNPFTKNISSLRGPLRGARSYGSSKSGGKLKFRKLSNSPKYKRRAKYVRDGVVNVTETGTLAADPECLYIGHSIPLYKLKFTAWWALMRKLLLKGGLDSGDLALTDQVGLAENDSIVLTYSVDNNTALTNKTYNYPFGGVTVQTLVEEFCNDTALNSPDVRFNSIDLIPYITFVGETVSRSNINRATIKLSNVVVDAYVKLDLKLQNQTVAITGNIESTDVNNAPIYGKSYEGYGLGPIYAPAGTGQGTLNWASNNKTGLIIKSASTLQGLKEPLEYQQFNNVKKIGKVHMDPGYCKTSTMFKKIHASFQYLMNSIAPCLADSNVDNGKKLSGKFAQYRLFAMEKMIDWNSSEALTNVTVGLEHNTKIMVYLKEKRTQVVQQAFEKIRI